MLYSYLRIIKRLRKSLHSCSYYGSVQHTVNDESLSLLSLFFNCTGNYIAIAINIANVCIYNVYTCISKYKDLYKLK